MPILKYFILIITCYVVSLYYASIKPHGLKRCLVFGSVDDVVSIFISQSDGKRIARLVDNGTSVRMYISVGRQTPDGYSHINKTSVLSVSIWFIVLMVISLAWLIF